MKNLKNLLVSFMAIVICFTICSCDKNKILTEEDMLRYANDQHGNGLSYTGMSLYGNEAITWFTADPLNPTTLAIVFSKNNDGSYTLVEDTNYFQDADACYFIWRNGIAVHIENEEIKEVAVGLERISVTEYPFNTYVEFKENAPNIDICYFDADGNKVV